VPSHDCLARLILGHGQVLDHGGIAVEASLADEVLDGDQLVPFLLAWHLW